MNWISIKDKSPKGPGIIVAIMNGRQERGGDPIEDALIVILRSDHEGHGWATMDCTEQYYLPDFLPEDGSDWFRTIKYWIPWNEFEFPKSMIMDEARKNN